MAAPKRMNFQKISKFPVYHESWGITSAILFPWTWQKNQASFLVGKNRLGGDVKMITLLHRRGWGWYFVGGYAQMIVILHWGGGSLGTLKSDYIICARPDGEIGQKWDLVKVNASELHFARFLGIPHLTIFCAQNIAKGKGGVERVFLWACLLSISKWFQSRRTDLI